MNHKILGISLIASSLFFTSCLSEGNSQSSTQETPIDVSNPIPRLLVSSEYMGTYQIKGDSLVWTRNNEYCDDFGQYQSKTESYTQKFQVNAGTLLLYKDGPESYPDSFLSTQSTNQLEDIDWKENNGRGRDYFNFDHGTLKSVLTNFCVAEILVDKGQDQIKSDSSWSEGCNLVHSKLKVNGADRFWDQKISITTQGLNLVSFTATYTSGKKSCSVTKMIDTKLDQSQCTSAYTAFKNAQVAHPDSNLKFLYKDYLPENFADQNCVNQVLQ